MYAKQLRYGKITWDELAYWSGHGNKTFLKNTTDVFDNLPDYAEYKQMKDGIVVNKIKKLVYAPYEEYCKKVIKEKILEKEFDGKIPHYIQSLDEFAIDEYEMSKRLRIDEMLVHLYYVQVLEESFPDLFDKYEIKKELERIFSKREEEYIEYENSQRSGIYGIYSNEELIYIGQTTQSFEKRFQQHKNSTFEDTGKLYHTLREEMYNGKQISYKPILPLDKMKVGKEEITKRDLDLIECAFITAFQPRANTMGMDKEYNFNYKDNKVLINNKELAQC